MGSVVSGVIPAGGGLGETALPVWSAEQTGRDGPPSRPFGV
ncbi:MAG TPA: hypothetical protein P5111_07300 [Kiritimatiellia bacterium]|nr:hypothetical protein [Kiritimatiellia bacterium]